MSEERFPPPFTPTRLRERADAHAHAIAHAVADGAGAIYHVGRFDLIEFALVLEPEEALAAARRVVFAGMNALAETIAADAPPERAIRFAYPATLFFDDGLIGGLRLAWPEGTGEDEAPDWLALSAMLRSGGLQEVDLALGRGATTLEEAGFRDIDGRAFAARFCRHLMAELDEWREIGFSGVGRRYLDRLTAEGEALRRIEPDGDLTVRREGAAPGERLSLVEGLASPGWYDPVLQGPTLRGLTSQGARP